VVAQVGRFLFARGAAGPPAQRERGEWAGRRTGESRGRAGGLGGVGETGEHRTGGFGGLRFNSPGGPPPGGKTSSSTGGEDGEDAMFLSLIFLARKRKGKRKELLLRHAASA
jgi:hypothetical protein